MVHYRRIDLSQPDHYKLNWLDERNSDPWCCTWRQPAPVPADLRTGAVGLNGPRARRLEAAGPRPGERAESIVSMRSVFSETGPPDRPLPRQAVGTEPDALRFGNALFGPLWAASIANIGLRSPRAWASARGDLGCTGALRRGQNHALQLLRWLRWAAVRTPTRSATRS
jgi:glucose-6-phosphate 1-dehydrogenase